MRTISGSFWWGLFLVALGVLFILDNMQVIQFGEFVRTYWPLLFILWGFRVLTKRRGRATGQNPGKTVEEVVAERITYSSFLGTVGLRISSKAFQGGSISTVFGDADIDLRNVGLAEGEHRLKVSGVFGNVTIALPKSLPVLMTSSTVFGSVQFNDQRREGFSAAIGYESPGYGTGRLRMKIEASEVFGDIVITTESKP